MRGECISTSFVAHSFTGNAKQAKGLLKASLSHNGIAVPDIISPCREGLLLIPTDLLVAFEEKDIDRQRIDWRLLVR